MFIDYVKFIDQGRGAGRHARRVHLHQAQGEHARALDPDPARAHLEQGQAVGGREQASRTRRRSSAPVPSRPSSGRRASTCAWSPTRTTGAAPPRSTRSSSRPTRTRTRWRRTSRPAPSRRGWNIPSAQFDAAGQRTRSRVHQGRHHRLRRARLQLRRQEESTPSRPGNPVLQDPAFRSALQWAVDKDKIVAIGYNGNAAPADTIVTRDFYTAEADYHLTPRRPPYSLRPRQGHGRRSTRPATPTATATASASTRASPSSCVCTRAPSRPRARTAASSSPAGSRRSASTSTTR